MDFTHEKVNIGIIGLGYVGLPLAVEFGKKFKTMGFDINQGLKIGRKLLLELCDSGIPTAVEFLDMITPQYLDDLIKEDFPELNSEMFVQFVF